MQFRLAAVWIGCLAATQAKAGYYSHLSGRILDPSEAGIPDASISLVNEESGFRRAAQSEPDGNYSINSLQPGLYRLLVRKPGFRTVIRFGLRLEAATAARLNVTLPVGSMQDAITVSGVPPLLNGEDATVATALTHSDIEHLPLNGRGTLTLVELTPGTIATPATRGESGQFSSNGQRPNTNYFTVDGISANTGVSGGGSAAQATGGALPGMSAFGSLDSLISPEAVDELTIRTSTAAADFGRLPGAAVSLTSRSGSSEVHGSTFYRFRHEDLSANDWFANRSGDSRAPLRLHNVTQTFGGPVRRSRTFFFLAYQGMRLLQPYAWRTPVPSLAARRQVSPELQPILSLFPAPNGLNLGGNLAEWTGRNRRPAWLQSGSLRVDHALTSRITLFGRYQDAPSGNEYGSTQLNRLTLRTRSSTFGVDARPRPNVVLGLRLNASTARARSVWAIAGADPCALDAVVSSFLRNPGPCDDFVRFTISGMGQLAEGSEGERRQTQFQIVQNAAYMHSRHSLRAGIDYRRLAPYRDDASGTLSIIAESIGDLINSNNLWSQTAPRIRTSMVMREFSAWLHDTWQATPRLTASAGLRWEFSPPPVPHDATFFLDESRATFVSDRRPLWRRTHANFAPRLGVAWRPKGDRTVIRGGAGLYYNSSLSIATDSINGGPLSLAQHGSAMHAPFPSLLSYGFMPDLILPRIVQWSFLIDRALDAHEALSIGYVGSSGHQLLRREMGGPGSTPTTYLALASNHGKSNYHGLQIQVRRSFARRVQGVASYSWGHALDNSSSDSLLMWAGPGALAARDWASSDFDLRHSISAGFSADIGRGWSLDGVLRARTGFPVTVTAAEQYLGIPLANGIRPDLVRGEPLWISDPGVPSGVRLNRNAFRTTSMAPQGIPVQGGLGRNAIAGFGMSQLDIALRREFPLGEQIRLQFRVEAFNALNQVNFADPVRFLDSPLFGQPASMLNLMLGTGSPASGLAPVFQNGGPRSVQVAVRFRF